MIELDGGALTLEAVEAVARRGDEVTLAPAAIRALGAAREFVDRLAAGAEPIYGITTGVGKLKDVVIPPGQRVELQRNLVLSHAGGMGAPLPDVEVRAIMLLLAASLARGASGVRPVVVETVIACLNRRVHPIVPELGSVGASGDLAPLAHVALCLVGEGTVSDEGGQLPAAQALARAGSGRSRSRPRRGWRSSTARTSWPGSARWRCSTPSGSRGWPTSPARCRSRR
jgi:histidine ammonia-lyase